MNLYTQITHDQAASFDPKDDEHPVANNTYEHNQKYVMTQLLTMTLKRLSTSSCQLHDDGLRRPQICDVKDATDDLKR